MEAVHQSSDVRITIEDLVAAENRAALRPRWHGINHAGQMITRETLELLRFANGRLIEHWHVSYSHPSLLCQAAPNGILG